MHNTNSENAWNVYCCWKQSYKEQYKIKVVKHLKLSFITTKSWIKKGVLNMDEKYKIYNSLEEKHNSYHATNLSVTWKITLFGMLLQFYH